MFLPVSTYPEYSSRALNVYTRSTSDQEQVGRVAHNWSSSEIEGSICSRLRRPIRLEPFHGITLRSALCDTCDEKRVPSYNNAHTPYVYEIKPFDLQYFTTWTPDFGSWMLLAGDGSETTEPAWHQGSSGQFRKYQTKFEFSYLDTQLVHGILIT